MFDARIISFFKAVEYLNFTEAANQLYITQSAFSKQILSLEEELGFQLFIRDNKKKTVRLTSPGAVYYREMIRIYQSYEAAMERVKRYRRGLEGKLRIGVLNGHILRPELKQLVFDFSHMSNEIQADLFNCSFAELREGIRKGKLDVALSLEVEMEGNRNCLCERLYQEQTCLLVPAGWGYDAGREYSIADFRKITFIVAKENEGISRMLYQLCQEHDFEPDTIVAPDFETMMLWIEQGLGVAGSGEGHLGKDSPYITSLSIREFHPLWFAVGWNKDNYNPLIPEFVENLLKGMNS